MQIDHHPAERPILQKVENGLKQAVEDTPDLEWKEEGTRIRRQKYTEQAVAHFTRNDDEPVLTSSWYKFGKTYPAAPSGANIGRGRFLSRNIGDSEIYEASLEDIARFFTFQAGEPPLDEEYWYMGTLDFLERFYNLHAPDKYLELYLQNLELRRLFEDTKHEISSLRGSQGSDTTSLGNFGSSTSVDYYKRAGRTAARLHMKLATIPELEETLDPVREYTDLVEDVLMELAEVDQSELRVRHSTAIDSLEGLYNSRAWAYVAALIMQETAEGPNRDWVVSQAERKLESLRESYTDDLNKRRRICAEAGLLPRPSDYPVHNDELESAIQGMMRTVDHMDE